MVLLSSLLLLLACLSGSFGQEDLREKVFVFPAASKKAAVLLNVSLQEPVTNFTACLRYNSPQHRPFTLFSYSTKSKGFQIVRPNPRQYNLQIGGMTRIIPLGESRSGWQHLCASWKATTGLVEVWENGNPTSQFAMKKGFKISRNGSIILGHEPDSWGERDSFAGKMTDVNMWLRVLKPEDINLVKKNKVGNIPNPLVKWSAFNYTTRGGVSVENALRPLS